MKHISYLNKFWYRTYFQYFSLFYQLFFDLSFTQVFILNLFSQLRSKFWILDQTITHIVNKLRDSEINVKLIVVWSNDLHQSRTECPDETSFVVFNHIFKVISDKIRLEVSQVKTTVVPNRKLIDNIQYDLVALSSCDELLCQCFAILVNLNTCYFYYFITYSYEYTSSSNLNYVFEFTLRCVSVYFFWFKNTH